MLRLTGAWHVYDEGDGDASVEHCETNTKRTSRWRGDRSRGGRRHEGEAKGGDDAKVRQRVPMAQLRHSENVQ